MKIKNLKSLKDEYLRSLVFGNVSKNSNRRSAEQIATDIAAESPEQSKKILTDLSDLAHTIQEAGEKARDFAKNGLKRSCLELEQLMDQVCHPEYAWIRSYIYTCYDNAANDTPATATEQKQSISEQSKPVKKWSKVNTLDFISIDLQSRSDASRFESDFPSDWKKPKYNSAPLQSLGECMYQYCWQGLWNPGESRTDAMEKSFNEARKFCKDERKLKAARETADQWLKVAIPEFRRAVKRKTDTPEQEKNIRKIGGPLPEHIKKQRKREQNSELVKVAKMNHVVQIKAAPVNMVPPSTAGLPSSHPKGKQPPANYPHHQNDIAYLTPAPSWTLYVDESGTSFNTNENGIMAGVLSCDQNPLPKQPKLHASENTTEEQLIAGDKVIETLLTHPNCGVIAVPVTAYRSATGWASLVCSLIDLVMRLLPLGGKKSKLKVLVENKEPYTKSTDFCYLRDACRFNLMHSYPERANLLDLSIEIMTKNDHRNAYPDIVSNACFTRKNNNTGKQRFLASGWGGTCFLDYRAEELSRLLDLFYKNGQLPAVEWAQLVSSQISCSNNLFSALLNLLGEEAQKNVPLWKKYLDHTVTYLSTGGLNLYRLHNQLEWLKRYQPAEEQLPPRIKLLWLTSKLAEANHLGEISQHKDVDKMFMELIRDLYEEDAPLTCFATLHLAVQMTNAFQFERAQKLLMDYSDIGSLLNPEPPFTKFVKDTLRKIIGDDRKHYLPAAIPGLRFYGQLLSSCGQHEAFLGNPDRAAIYFEEAINCFQRLSENREDDIDKTLAYATTAAMDLDPAGSKALELLKCYLNKTDLSEAAKALAANSTDIDKYHHHIFLRYLAHSNRKECKDAIKMYCTQKENWETGNGHPWEMIEFYRGILVENKEEKLNLFRHAYEMALEGGPTLHIIACVILGSIAYYDHSVVTELSELIEKTVAELPALGNERVSCLHCQCQQPLEPLTFAKAILPFNFR